VHGPPGVAEVPLELAEDGRHGVGRERDAAVGLVAVDRLDEPEAGNLQEVVERLAAALVAPRQPAGQGQEALDENLARRRVARLPVVAEENVGVG
jgi:hypothetical protein